MRRSFPQVKRCPRGPHMFSSSWASLAEDGFAGEETKIGHKNHDSVQQHFLKDGKNTVHLLRCYVDFSGSLQQYLTTGTDNGSANVKY